MTAPGAPPRSARYTGDQGSTILPRGEENVFFDPVKVPRNLPDASTQDWPMGEVGATTPVPDGVDSNAVAAALDWAMAQEEQKNMLQQNKEVREQNREMVKGNLSEAQKEQIRNNGREQSKETQKENSAGNGGNGGSGNGSRR